MAVHTYAHARTCAPTRAHTHTHAHTHARIHMHKAHVARNSMPSHIGHRPLALLFVVGNDKVAQPERALGSCDSQVLAHGLHGTAQRSTRCMHSPDPLMADHCGKWEPQRGHSPQALTTKSPQDNDEHA